MHIIYSTWCIMIYLVIPILAPLLFMQSLSNLQISIYLLNLKLAWKLLFLLESVMKYKYIKNYNVEYRDGKGDKIGMPCCTHSTVI